MRIALFDSGYGGLTVLSHARRVLPSEEFIFYADRDHVPYGTKSVPVVRGFVRTAFRFLIEQQRADAVVVACNTATSVAVNEMRRLYDVPIIGMEPAVKKALTHDAEHRVLVTATPITVHGEKLNLHRIVLRIILRSCSAVRISTISRIRCGSFCRRMCASWMGMRERWRSSRGGRGCERSQSVRRPHNARSLRRGVPLCVRRSWRTWRRISRVPREWKRLFERSFHAG